MECLIRQNIVADMLSRKPDTDLNNLSISANTVLESLPAEYENEPEFGVVYHTLNTMEEIPKKLSVRLRNYRLVGKLLYFGTRVCIPRNNKLRRKIIYEHHDTPFSAHPGIDRTYLSIQRQYYWPKMDKLVRKYVSSCDICQRTKTSNRNPSGLLQPLPIPTQPW